MKANRKFKRTIVTSVAALALLGGATACKSAQPTVGNPVVIIHNHPTPVHTTIHIHIAPKPAPKKTVKVIIHKH